MDVIFLSFFFSFFLFFFLSPVLFLNMSRSLCVSGYTVADQPVRGLDW